MAFAQYNSCRPQTPLTHITLDIVPGGATTIAHNGNAYIQFENRAGRNLLSQPIPFSIPAGNKAVFTFADGIIESGEEVFWIVISIEDTGNSQDAIIIAKIAVRNSDQLTSKPFPIVIELSSDDHFASLSVASYSQLPSTDFLLGQIIFVADEANYYIYDEWSTDWLLYPEGRNAYLSSTTADKGCDRVLTDAIDALRTPTKIGNADTIPLKLWWRNGFTADGLSPVPANTRLTIDISINGSSVSVDGKSYSTIFANKIKATLAGYVDTTTGILDTSQAQAQIIWNPVTNHLILPEDLPRGHAATWEFILSFDAEIMLGILIPGASIDINLVEISENIGTPSPIATTIGDLIFAEGDRLRIVPTPMRLSGAASVKTGYLISSTQELPFSGLLAADTANQRITLLGSLNGYIQVRQPGEQLLPDEIVRAIASTEPGRGQIASININVLPNSALNITITHPTTVRSDYPDVIAGNSKGSYTPLVGRIGISDGINFYEENTTRSLGTADTVNFIITDLTNFTNTTIHSPDTDFDLFRSEIFAIELPGAGSFNGNYTIYFWAEYESLNTAITRITHDPLDGVVRELSQSLSEIQGDMTKAEYDTDNDGAIDVSAGGTGANNPADALNQLGAASQSSVIANINSINGIQNTLNNLGTAANKNIGTNIGSAIELVDDGNGNAGLPAVSGALLTNLPNATANQVFEVADITARDAITGQSIADIAKVADDGTGNPKDYVWNGSAWIAFVGSSSGGSSSSPFAQDIGDGTNSVLAVNHNLASRDLFISVYRNSAPFDEVEVGVERTDINNISLDFGATVPTTGEYRVIINNFSSSNAPFTQDIGDGTNSILAINHNLGSRDVFVSIYRNSAPFDEVEVGVERTDVNNISLDFGATIPTAGEYRVVVNS